MDRLQGGAAGARLSLHAARARSDSACWRTGLPVLAKWLFPARPYSGRAERFRERRSSGLGSGRRRAARCVGSIPVWRQGQTRHPVAGSDLERTSASPFPVQRRRRSEFRACCCRGSLRYGAHRIGEPSGRGGADILRDRVWSPERQHGQPDGLSARYVRRDDCFNGARPS